MSSTDFLLGDGIFETLRARHGRIFRWPLHRERMARGLDMLGIDPAAMTLAEIALNATCQAAAAGNGRAYPEGGVSRAARVNSKRHSENNTRNN